MRQRVCFTGLVALLGALAACSNPRPSESRSASPTAPTGAAPAAPASPGVAFPARTPAGPTRGDEGRRAIVLPADGDPFASVVAFPPRNESFEFRNALERKYLTDLGRPPAPTFVDVEGDVVWMQEYLRYRVNRCSHDDASLRVLNQILGRGIAPVCGDPPAGVVGFPPRDESFAFRTALEQLYRDGLGRSPSSSSVNIEGTAVWVQEYLRYRVNRCGHVAAQQKVLAQIDGQGIAPVCMRDLSSVWNGTVTNFFNSPFVMDLAQTGDRIVGTYRDQNDRGGVDGTVSGDVVRLNVRFGDTGHQLNGHWDGADIVNGDFTAGGGIGRRSFEMRRQ